MTLMPIAPTGSHFARVIALVGIAVVSAFVFLRTGAASVCSGWRCAAQHTKYGYTGYPQPEVGANMGKTVQLLAKMGGMMEMPAVNFGVGSFRQTSDVNMMIKSGVRGFSLMIHDGPVPPKQVAKGIADAIATGYFTRNDFFITVAPFCSQDVSQFMADGGLDRVDMITLHQPCSTYEATLAKWRELEGVVKAGKATSLGVCNYKDMDELRQLSIDAEFPPIVNSIGYDVTKYSRELDEAHLKMGITIMPYTPLKTAKNEPEVIEVASKMGVTSAQIALRFFTQTNHPVLTFSQSAEHMKQNLKSSEIEISVRDLEALEA